MPRFDRKAGVWVKTQKEIELEQTKASLEEKVADQEQQIALLTATLGDFMLGGM